MMNVLILLAVNIHASYGSEKQNDDWNKIWLDHAHYDRAHLTILGTKEISGLFVWQNSKGKSFHTFNTLTAQNLNLENITGTVYFRGTQVQNVIIAVGLDLAIKKGI